MISGWNEQLQQQLEYTLLKSDCHSWISKGQHSSNRVSGISTRTIYQFTTPSLSQTIRPRWASTQFLSIPKDLTLLPVAFGTFLSSEAVVMRQLRRWKRLWRRSLTCLHKRASMGPSRICWNGTTSALQLEEITSKRIVFHVCTINKSAHTEKVWKLIVCTSYFVFEFKWTWNQVPRVE